MNHLLLIVLSVCLCALDVAWAESDCLECVADFAIYNPDYEDDGVWEEEVVALEHMFRAFGWTFRPVSHQDINSGALGAEKKRRFRALVAPGGWSWWREAAVTPEGDRNIRSFLKNGGHYVGFCAGAYAAAKRIVWAQEASSPEKNSRPADYNGIFSYELAIYPGDARGPLGWMPWRNGTNVNFDRAEINLKNPTMAAIGLPAEVRFLYGGGPFFPDAEKIPGVEIWARAKTTVKGQSRETGAQQPTIIRYPVGDGSVTLFSYHPDVLIKHSSDGIALHQFFNEDTIAWDLGGGTFDQINLWSWNIVHAALQLASNRPVTRMEKVPDGN